jgi:hypothetical protein
MSETTEEFQGPVGPTTAATGGIANIAVGTASAAVDLTGANYTTLKAAIDAGRFLTLCCNADIWYRWDTATGTVDETKTAASTPANQGILLPAGAERTERPPPGTTWIIVKAPAATMLWLWISSRGLNQDIKPS